MAGRDSDGKARRARWRNLIAGVFLAGWAPPLVGEAAAAEVTYLARSDEGKLRCEVPAGWQLPEFDERPWLAPPPAPPDAGGSDGGTPCGALRLARRFDTAAEAARLVSLTLRLRYRDGFVAMLNGVEVARRGLAPGATVAAEPHGNESERFVIPLRRDLLRPRGNLLAVEVRAAPPRLPAASLELTGSDAVRLLRGPYLQRVQGSEGFVVIETDLPSRARLAWGPLDPVAAHEARESTDGILATRHVLRFDHLLPATRVRYRVTATSEGAGTVEAAAELRTLPRPGERLRFVVFGDVRSGHDIHAELNRAIVAEQPDFALVTGDLVDRGSDEGEWERYFEVAAPLLQQVAIYPAPGNHEYARRGRGIARFADLFLRDVPSVWWSFDIGGYHFVCVDSERYDDPAQRAWIERDLAAARRRRARAIFVYDHDGPWSSGLHGDNRLALRDYVPLYQRHRVSVVFSGHDHDYERGRVGGIDYLVSGGGGAELRRPRCSTTREPGLPRCSPRVRIFANEHHYLLAELQGNRLRVCPKRADGTLLEPCFTLPLRR